MYDRNKIERDKEGYLIHLADWSETVATEIAAEIDIELGDAHWRVIEGLRQYFLRTDISPAMRPFVKLVKTEIDEDLGSSIALMSLFGSSPAKSAAKIAGLPKPTNCL